MSEPIIYQLKEPFTIKLSGAAGDREETRSEVSVRSDVRVRDLRVLDSVTGGVARGAALIHQLCDLTTRQVDDLCAADFIALSEIVAGFMPPGLATGETA